MLIFVGGEPTASLPAALDLLAVLDELPPLGWDTNLLLSPASRELLEGVVDTYIADLKFGNDACAERLAGAERYMERMEENLIWARGAGRLIVRHLLLPGHYECCFKPLLAWLAERIGPVRLSLGGQYLPPEGGSPPEGRLGEYLEPYELAHAREAARRAGFEPIDGGGGERYAALERSSCDENGVANSEVDGFEIRIRPDGRLYVSLLNRPMLELAAELAPADAGLARRLEMARARSQPHDKETPHGPGQPDQGS
jgi:hypothetical protein